MWSGLSLILNSDLNEILYIQSIAKDAGKMVGSMYHSSKYLTPAIHELHLLSYMGKSCPFFIF